MRLRIVDWRRLAIALPVLAVIAVALFWLLRDGDATASTPKAVLVDAPPGVNDDVGVHQGALARDFTATTLNGAPVRLSDLRGTPAIINFWATWCTSCLAEMPDLKEVQAEFGADRLQVVAVNSGESAAEAREFVQFLEADEFVYAMDPSLAVTDAYGVIGLSYSVFLDADGVIRATYTGQLSKELMREYAAAAIAGADGDDPPFAVRLPGTVEARSSALVVEDVSDTTIRITSRRLRCDDTFCADAIINEIAEAATISSILRNLHADPPFIEVTFHPDAVSREQLIARVAALVDAGGDPLYQSGVTVEEAVAD